MPLPLIQILLIVLWYAIPDAAAIPAWVIFLPLELIGVFLVIAVLLAIVAAWFSSPTKKTWTDL